MSAAFGRDALLDAFDQIGRAAVLAGTRIQIAVYGGSALMLASNFRFATEDVDVSELEHPLPGWLATVVDKIAKENGWQEGWFNDGVAFHLSSLADRALGACPNSRCSILSESDSSLSYEQVFSPLEYRSDTAAAAECAGLRAERPCLGVYR